MDGQKPKGALNIGVRRKRSIMQGITSVTDETRQKKGKKKGGPVDVSKIKPEEMLKYEIARELGLYDKVIANGWRSLTAKESGRIGGIMTRRRMAEQKQKNVQQKSIAEE